MVAFKRKMPAYYSVYYQSVMPCTSLLFCGVLLLNFGSAVPAAA